MIGEQQETVCDEEAGHAEHGRGTRAAGLDPACACNGGDEQCSDRFRGRSPFAPGSTGRRTFDLDPGTNQYMGFAAKLDPAESRSGKL
jgi:hypothetical protein